MVQALANGRFGCLEDCVVASVRALGRPLVEIGLSEPVAMAVVVVALASIGFGLGYALRRLRRDAPGRIDSTDERE